MSIEVRKAKAAQMNTACGSYMDDADSEGTLSDYDTYISPLRTPDPEEKIGSTEVHNLRGRSHTEASVAALFDESRESHTSQKSCADNSLHSSDPCLQTQHSQASELEEQQVHHANERSIPNDTRTLKRKMASSPSPERKRQRIAAQDYNLNTYSAKTSNDDNIDIRGPRMPNDETPIGTLASPSACQIARELRIRSTSSSQNPKRQRDHVRFSSSKEPEPNTPLYDALYVNPRELPDYSDLGTFRHAVKEELGTQTTQPDDPEHHFTPFVDESSPEYLEMKRVWATYPPPSFHPQTAEEWEQVNTPWDVKIHEIQLKQLEDYPLKAKGDIGKYEIDWNSTVIPVWAQPTAYTAFHEWRKEQLGETPSPSNSSDSKASVSHGSETVVPSALRLFEQKVRQYQVSAAFSRNTNHFNTTPAITTDVTLLARPSQGKKTEASILNNASVEHANPAAESNIHPQQLTTAQELAQSAKDDSICSLSHKEPGKIEVSTPNVASMEYANLAVESNQSPQQLASMQELHQRNSENAGHSLSPKHSAVESVHISKTRTPSNSSSYTADSESPHTSPASSPPADTQDLIALGEEGRDIAFTAKKQKRSEPARQSRKEEKKSLGSKPSKVEKSSARMTRFIAKTNQSTKFQKLDNAGRLSIDWDA